MMLSLSFPPPAGAVPVAVHVESHVTFQPLVAAQDTGLEDAFHIGPPAVPVPGGHGTVPVPKGGPWS